MAFAWERLLPPDLAPDRIVHAVGLVSDTHAPARCATLPPALFDALAGVDLLLHAGDVGELWVLDQLSVIAPVIAVHGNDETLDAQRELPYQQLITVAGQRVLLTHAHYPDRAEELASRRDNAWGPKLERRAAMGRRAGANIVVFGHTHVPMMYQHADVLLVNPGAIASGNWISRQVRQSVALLLMREDEPPFVVHIDLQAPDLPWTPQVDWQAGFLVALDEVSESILAPDLQSVWNGVSERLRPWLDDPRIGPSLHAVIEGLAFRCWAGQQRFITRGDLVREVRAATAIPVQVRGQIESALVSEPSL